MTHLHQNQFRDHCRRRRDDLDLDEGRAIVLSKYIDRFSVECERGCSVGFVDEFVQSLRRCESIDVYEAMRVWREGG